MAPFQVDGVQLSQGCRSAETLQGGETVNFLPHLCSQELLELI